MKVCSKCGVEKPADVFVPGTRQCRECKAAYLKRWLAANLEYKRQKDREYHLRNKDKIAEKRRRWYASNKDKVKASNAEWRRNNRDRANAARLQWAKANPEKVRRSTRRWVENNPDKVNAIAAKRRAARLRATPPWLTPEQQAQIDAMYAQARRLQELVGGEVHVDHIVPLRGRNVCGLHVPWNLRPLDAVDNLRKNNRLVESN